MRVKCVRKSEVGNNDIAVPIQKQVLKLQIAMDDALLMEVSNTRYELSEQTTCGVVLKITVVENVIKELAAGGVLEDDTDVLIGLDHLVETDDVWVRDLAKDGNFAVDLC